jgi:hypothetical protein
MGNLISAVVPGYLSTGDEPRLDDLDSVVWYFEFDTGNPFEVTLRVASDVDHEPWRFDRTLLKAAVCAPQKTHPVVYGHGDVKFGRVPSGLAFRLKGPETIWGVALVDSLVDFVRMLDQTVKPGEESYDVDSWLDQMGLS